MASRQSSQKPEEQPLPHSNGKVDGSFTQSGEKQGHPRETVEEASRSVNLVVPKNSFQVSHAELRKNFKVRVSGDLARGLWYLLGFVVVVHLMAVITFSWRLGNKPDAGDPNDQRTARLEKAVSTVSDTAKTLYAVLGVLTTAITGYYFTTGSDSAPADDED